MVRHRCFRSRATGAACSVQSPVRWRTPRRAPLRGAMLLCCCCCCCCCCGGMLTLLSRGSGPQAQRADGDQGRRRAAQIGMAGALCAGSCARRPGAGGDAGAPAAPRGPDGPSSARSSASTSARPSRRRAGSRRSPPPLLPSRTNWTRLVPRPVLNGHVSSPPVLTKRA